MKEEELRAVAECNICGNPFGRGGQSFWRVKLVRHNIIKSAIDEQQGLAMQLGGNGLLASLMGADPEMTTIEKDIEITICERCANQATTILDLSE